MAGPEQQPTQGETEEGDVKTTNPILNTPSKVEHLKPPMPDDASDRLAKAAEGERERLKKVIDQFYSDEPKGGKNEGEEKAPDKKIETLTRKDVFLAELNKELERRINLLGNNPEKITQDQAAGIKNAARLIESSFSEKEGFTPELKKEAEEFAKVLIQSASKINNREHSTGESNDGSKNNAGESNNENQKKKEKKPRVSYIGGVWRIVWSFFKNGISNLIDGIKTGKFFQAMSHSWHKTWKNLWSFKRAEEKHEHH